MTDEMIDFDSPSTQNDTGAQADTVRAVGMIASLNARAVMPDGRTLDRGQILQALGLNPNTPPTAWLTVIGCGSNASALLPGDLQRIAASRVSNAAAILSRVQNLGSVADTATGYASGGQAPK